MKVIVVDDSLVMRKIIAAVVESLGHKALHAANGHQMLDILEEMGDGIGLVLLDWNMPGLNGIEALRIMRQNARFRCIPVFMVSTESEGARVSEAIKAGAADYLAKPFTSDELAAKIQSALEKS